jgi:hypothetical protein
MSHVKDGICAGGRTDGMTRNILNRRMYRRIQAPIHCRQAGVEFFAPQMDPIDISFGGLRIYSDEEYPVGAYLRLDIFIPGASPAPFTAEVMWIRASDQGAPGRFDVGLAFVGLTPDALNILRPLLGQEEELDGSTEWKIEEVPAPAESAVDIDLEEESTEPPPASPATVRKR